MMEISKILLFRPFRYMCFCGRKIDSIPDSLSGKGLFFRMVR